MDVRRIHDPLRNRLAESDMRIRIADADVRKACETWILVRAAYGCPAPAGLVEAMCQSGMCGVDVKAFAVRAGEEDRPQVDQ